MGADYWFWVKHASEKEEEKETRNTQDTLLTKGYILLQLLIMLGTQTEKALGSFP